MGLNDKISVSGKCKIIPEKIFQNSIINAMESVRWKNYSELNIVVKNATNKWGINWKKLSLKAVFLTTYLQGIYVEKCTSEQFPQKKN